MKHLIDPEEVERYEAPADYAVILTTLIAISIGIVAIAWQPDVEAIGTYIYGLI